MLLKRIITSLGILLFSVLIVFYDSVSGILLVILTLAISYEWYFFCMKQKIENDYKFSMFIILFSMFLIFNTYAKIPLFIALFFIVEDYLMLTFGAIYFGLFFISAGSLTYVYCGKVLLFEIIIISFLSDIGGYMFGNLFGGKKIFPNISPQKTIGGSIGATFFPLLIFCLFTLFFPPPSPESLGIPPEIADRINFGMYKIIVFLSITSQLGDLLMSALKRRAGLKDTSNILPGHGGVLDRLDSIIFNVIIAFMPLFVLLFYAVLI